MDNPSNDLHIYDSVSACLFSLFILESVVDRCEFIAILMCHSFDLLLFVK